MNITFAFTPDVLAHGTAQLADGFDACLDRTCRGGAWLGSLQAIARVRCQEAPVLYPQAEVDGETLQADLRAGFDLLMITGTVMDDGTLRVETAALVIADAGRAEQARACLAAPASAARSRFKALGLDLLSQARTAPWADVTA